jgi:integrase
MLPVMATLRKKDGSKYWFAVFYDAHGKQRQRSTRIADAGNPAERGIARRKAFKVAMEYEETARGNRTEAGIRQTIKELFESVNEQRLEFVRTDRFLTAWADRAATAKKYRTAQKYKGLANAFLDYLGERKEKKLADITAGEVQGFVDRELSAGKSAQSVTGDMKILRIPFNQAARAGLIISNPVAAVELPEVAAESRKAFDWKQVKAIIAAATGEWETAILLAVFTGARLGDCVNMRCENVDIFKKTVTFTPEKTNRRAQRKEVVIPLCDELLTHLVRLKGTRKEGPLCPTLAKSQIGGRRGLSRQFQEIMARAEIEQEFGEEKTGRGRQFRKYGFHSLRHSCLSELANAGVEQDIRKALAGHASNVMSERYTHREITVLRDAIDKLPAIKG